MHLQVLILLQLQRIKLFKKWRVKAPKGKLNSRHSLKSRGKRKSNYENGVSSAPLPSNPSHLPLPPEGDGAVIRVNKGEMLIFSGVLVNINLSSSLPHKIIITLKLLEYQDLMFKHWSPCGVLFNIFDAHCKGWGFNPEINITFDLEHKVVLVVSLLPLKKMSHYFIGLSTNNYWKTCSGIETRTKNWLRVNYYTTYTFQLDLLMLQFK